MLTRQSLPKILRNQIFPPECTSERVAALWKFDSGDQSFLILAPSLTQAVSAVSCRGGVDPAQVNAEAVSNVEAIAALPADGSGYGDLRMWEVKARATKKPESAQRTFYILARESAVAARAGELWAEEAGLGEVFAIAPSPISEGRNIAVSMALKPLLVSIR